MPRVNIPLLTNKVKSVEFASPKSSLVSAGLAGTTLINEDDIAYAIKFLGDDSSKAFTERFRFLRESKGSLLLSIASGFNSVRPLHDPVVKVLLAIYAESVLFSIGEDSRRLVDALDMTFSVYDSVTRTSNQISTANCFTNKAAPRAAIITAYNQVKDLLRMTGTFLKPTDITSIDNFLNTIMSYEALDPTVYTTAPAIILSLLASHLKMMHSILITTSSIGAVSGSAIVNAVQVKIPTFLDSTNSTTLLMDLCRYRKMDDLLKTCSDAISMELGQILEENKKTGAYELSSTSCEKFLSFVIKRFNEICVPFEAFDRHLNTRFKLLPRYIQLKLYLYAAGKGSIEEGDRKLIRALINLGKLGARASTTLSMPLDDATTELAALESRVSEIKAAVLGVIDDYFMTEIDRFGTGFSITKSFIQGKEIIYRLDKVIDKDPSALYEVLEYDLISKGRKISNLGVIPISLTTKKLVNPVVTKPDHLGLEKSGTLTLPTVINSKYGCVVTGVDFLDLTYALLARCQFLDLSFSDVAQSGSGFVDFECYTILPPRRGPDVISFGASARRENSTQNFEIEPLGVEGVDVIDLLFSWPSSAVKGIQNDSEKLENLYMKRLEAITKIAYDPVEVRYSDVYSLKRLDYKYDLYSALTGNSSVKRLINQFDSHFIPSSTTLAAMDAAKLPAFVKCNRYHKWEFIVPFTMLSKSVQNTIRTIGSAHGFQFDNGDFSWRVDPLNGHCTHLSSVSEVTGVKAPDETIEIDGKKVKTAFGTLVSKMPPNTDLYLVTINLDSREFTKSSLGFVPKNPRDVKFSVIDAKKEVLRGIDYGVPSINDAVKTRSVTFIRNAGAIKLSDNCARRNRLNFTMDDASTNTSSLAAEVYFGMVSDALTAYSGIWGSIFDKSRINLEVLLNEGESLCKRFESAYDPKIVLHLTGVDSNNTVEELCKAVKALNGHITAKAAEHVIFKDLEKIYSLRDPYCDSKMYLYQLRTPMPVDEFDRGYVDAVLQGNIAAVKMPRVYSSIIGNLWNDVFVDSVSAEIEPIILDWLNFEALSGQF